MSIPLSIYKVSRFRSIRLCGIIICQCLVLFVVSCPPSGAKYTSFSTDGSDLLTPFVEGSSTQITTTGTIGDTPEPVQKDLKIKMLTVQPDKPNDTRQASVRICKEDSEAFDQCCHTNQLWYVQPNGKKRGIMSEKVISMCTSSVNRFLLEILDAELLENQGEMCFNHCDQKNGPCKWCGKDGMCCRQGFIGNGCDGKIGGKSYHVCINRKFIKGTYYEL